MSFPLSGGVLHALKSISLRIQPGELVSLIGSSGCGKTTLLRLIAGLLQPTAGRVSIGGKTTVEARMAGEIGFVFQNPVLFPWRTVIKNILLPGEILNGRHDGRRRMTRCDWEQRAREMLELVGLKGFENAFPGQLSGGMQSRVAIARALSFSPRILLMDEPFGDLDEITRLHMNQELLRLQASTGATILFVTHSIREAVYLSDRVTIMSPRPGEIIETLEINLPKARRIEMQETPDFGDCTRLLRSALGISS